MERTPLSQFLQSICCSSPWNYAVFWKLQYENQMILTFEDYYRIPKQKNVLDSMSHNICFEDPDEILSSSIYDGNMGRDPVDLALAYMSNIHQYTWGEGVVGEVACSGNYRWVFSGDTSAGGYGSKVQTEWHDHWIVQFAAGIKTLLLVPVVPYGVLEIGSLERVAEDQALVALLKYEFFEYQELMGYAVRFSTNLNFDAHSTSSLMSTLEENELSGLCMNGIKSEDSTIFSSAIQRCLILSTSNKITPPNKGEKSKKLVGEDVPKIPKFSTKNNVSVQLVGYGEERKDPEILSHSSDCFLLEMKEKSMLRLSYTGEELQSFSHPTYKNMTTFPGECAIETYLHKGMSVQSLLQEDEGNLFTSFNFPSDCELHKALGPTIIAQPDKYLRDITVSDNVELNGSSLICSGELSYGTGSTPCETGRPFSTGGDVKNMLESINTDAKCSLDSNLSDMKSSMASLEQFSIFPIQGCEHKKRNLVVEEAASGSCVTSAVADKGRNANNSTSPSASSFKSVVSALIGDELQKKGPRGTNLKKGSNLSTESKSRAKAHDVQKPRPRDRQLIQDRLMELRNLVPNGAKCSIDCLLDKTIQHMQFLRSVSDQADRLRKLVHHEIAGSSYMKLSEREGGQQNGTSWACEPGNEQKICPIIVEDLAYAGHMLIEMLCTDHKRFLDISEVICRLELTILKGVMKNCSGNGRAQFIVEVPRGFHRLDIFWPLMQLLQ